MCKCTPPGSHDKTTKREEYGVADSLIQDIFHGHQLSHTVRVVLKRALYFCRCRVGRVDLSTTYTCVLRCRGHDATIMQAMALAERRGTGGRSRRICGRAMFISLRLWDRSKYR